MNDEQMKERTNERVRDSVLLLPALFLSALSLCCVLHQTKGSQDTSHSLSSLSSMQDRAANLALLGHKGPQTS